MNRVGIIGAGAAGLSALRHFLDSTKFTPIVWEKSQVIGGTWVYTDQLEKDVHDLPVHSSMYQSLKTNLPKEAMSFPDFPFPPGGNSFIHHTEVLAYLQKYAHNYDLEKHIQFEHAVEHVTPIEEGSTITGWRVTVRDLNTNTTNTVECAALLVCNGHYSVPCIPQLEGIDQFSGLVEHSHRYREPSQYTDRTVLVLGASASGLDISLELATVAKKVYLSHNHPVPVPSKLPDNLVQVAGAVKIKDGTRDVLVLKDGQEVRADALLYCTGYHYTFPFLSDECGVSIEDNQVKPLYRHLVHCRYPTMAILGVPFQICPFPFFDIQVRYMLRAWSGDFALPSTEEMMADAAEYRRQRLEAGVPERHLHKMGTLQWGYNDELAEAANVNKLAPVVGKLYDFVYNSRKENLMNYKTRSYCFIDDKNFEEVKRCSDDRNKCIGG